MKCVHGMDPRFCALCNGVVRQVVQPAAKQTRLQKSMLRAADSKFSGVSLAGYEWAEGMFDRDPDSDKLDPNQIHCSFCGRPTEKLDLTSERKPQIRTRVDHHQHSDGTIEIREHVEASSETLHACPDCCLQIRKPITVQRV